MNLAYEKLNILCASLTRILLLLSDMADLGLDQAQRVQSVFDMLFHTL